MSADCPFNIFIFGTRCACDNEAPAHGAVSTGVGGVASAVVANIFDHTDYFRDFRGQSFSLKRRRTDGGRWEGPDERHLRYDITKDYPPLSYPPPQVIDLPAVKALLVDAAKEAAELEKADGDGKLTQKQHSKVQSKSILTLFKLVETIVEKAVIPWAEAGGPRLPPGVAATAGPHRSPPK